LPGVAEQSGLLQDELDSCRNFGDVFELVKKSVKRSLGRSRAGLMLYLADLPPNIGALHGIGTNAIVMNRAVLSRVTSTATSRRDVNSFVYSVLLHEYLHSLGYVDEREVRELTLKVARDNLGVEHPATRISTNPMAYFPQQPQFQAETSGGDAEIVRDFDRSNQNYVV